MNNCPECGSALGKSAYKCRCGWKAQGNSSPDPERPRIQCDYVATCLESALIRYNEQNLCLAHYLGRIGEERHHRWIAAGRPSAAESIAKMKELAKKPKPTPREHWQRVLDTPNAPLIAREAAEDYMRRFSREPGQDDEETL